MNPAGRREHGVKSHAGLLRSISFWSYSLAFVFLEQRLDGTDAVLFELEKLSLERANDLKHFPQIRRLRIECFSATCAAPGIRFAGNHKAFVKGGSRGETGLTNELYGAVRTH